MLYEKITNKMLVITMKMWKSYCEKNKTQEDHDCNKCDLLLEEISRRLLFGEMNAALIEKLDIDPKELFSVALSKIKEIKEGTKDPEAEKLGEKIMSLFSKILQDIEKEDLIKNLKDKKIDGDPS